MCLTAIEQKWTQQVDQVADEFRIDRFRATMHKGICSSGRLRQRAGSVQQDPLLSQLSQCGHYLNLELIPAKCWNRVGLAADQLTWLCLGTSSTGCYVMRNRDPSLATIETSLGDVNTDDVQSECLESVEVETYVQRG